MRASEERIAALEKDMKKAEDALAKAYQAQNANDSDVLVSKLAEIKAKIEEEFITMEALERKL